VAARGTAVALVLKGMSFAPFFSKGLLMYVPQTKPPLIALDYKQRLPMGLTFIVCTVL
jgi:hypothetical protein